MNSTPTPYEDVNSIVLLLLQKSQAILGNDLLAMYLHGSLVTGDFNQKGSDIDFMIVLDKELSDETIQQLQHMLGELVDQDSSLANKLEGSYVQKDLLKSSEPPKIARPYINGGVLKVCPYGYEWVVEKFVIRDKGIIVTGPPPSTFIDQVAPDDVRRANAKILRENWEPMLSESSRLEDDEYQVYAVLTMCRCLFFFVNNELVSKKKAGQWAQEKFKEWEEVAEVALKWTSGQEFNRLDEVKNFIRFTIEFTNTRGGEKDNIS